MEESEFRITPFQQALASCSGAIVTSLFVTPLDVVKIRLQAQQQSPIVKGNKCFLYCNGLMDHICSCGPGDPTSKWFEKPAKQFNGTIDAFVKISRTEGLSSLWSGLSPTLVLAVPATVVYFVAYEQIRLRISSLHKKRFNKSDKRLPFWIPLISGATARMFSVTVVSPLELIRTKMQSQRLSYAEVHIALKNLIAQDGITALWKGIFPTLYRDVPFSAIYWMNYEFIKSFHNPDRTAVPFYWVSFFGGAISGLVAATVTTPFDVVKTHQQIEFGEKTLYASHTAQKRRTTLEVLRNIYAQHGFRGYFAGLAPRLIKVAPACAIMISSFEYGKVFFYKLSVERQRSENEKISIKEAAASSTSSSSTGNISGINSQVLGAS